MIRVENLKGISIGDTIYSERYNLVGKVLGLYLPHEVEFDAIDLEEEGINYCDVREVRLATEDEIKKVFEVNSKLNQK